MGLRVLLVAGVALLASEALAAKQCGQYLEVSAGQTFTIQSPGYPNSYPGGVNCYWQFIAPSRSLLNLQCNDFYINPSRNCADGKLLVSTTGDPSLSDGHTYCGSGSINMQSEGNQMTMQLITLYYSTGRFQCTITATQQPTPPPPTCDCGWKNQARIVNGQETGVNEYPMMAGLIDLDLKELVCGSTIIAARYCLTAAHCLLNRPIETTGILVGDHDIFDANETNSAQVLLVESFVAYPDYDSYTQKNDIAVIRTATPIIYTLLVGPACLPFRFPYPKVGAAVVVLGWGTTEQAGPKSNVLLQTELDVINITQCKDTFGPKVSDNQLCTFRNGTDACQADSGGPVLWTGPGPDNRLQLFGVISYGKGCAIRYPGVNTRVYAYIDWILRVTPDAEYCVR